MRQQKAQLQKDTEKRQENVNDSPDSQPQLKDEQSRPKVWMGARMLKEQTCNANAQVGKNCDVLLLMDMCALAPRQTVLIIPTKKNQMKKKSKRNQTGM